MKKIKKITGDNRFYHQYYLPSCKILKELSYHLLKIITNNPYFEYKKLESNVVPQHKVAMQ